MTHMRERLILAYTAVWTISAAVLLAIVLSPYNHWNPLWFGAAGGGEAQATSNHHGLGILREVALLGFLTILPLAFILSRGRNRLTRSLLKYAAVAWTVLIFLYLLARLFELWFLGIVYMEYDRFRAPYAEPIAVEYLAIHASLLLQGCVLLFPVFVYWLFGRPRSTNGAS